MRQLATLLVLLLSLFATPVKADQNDAKLDPLFARLLEFKSYGEARPVEGDIWRIWTSNADGVVNTLMEDGLAAMGRTDRRHIAHLSIDQFNAIAINEHAGLDYAVKLLHVDAVDQFHRMIEAGVFVEGDRIELIDGKMRDMAQTGPPPGGCTDNLNK